MEVRMTDIRELVSERLTKRKHVSEQTRRHLEKFARLLCPDQELELVFGDVPTADSRYTGETYRLRVTSNPMDQPATDIESGAWELLGREALTIHEVGHVLYTDFDALTKRLKATGGGREAKRLFNALEDAAIDEQLRRKFDCGRELDTHLANLFYKQDDQMEALSFMGGVHTAILEKGVYSVGYLEEYEKGERALVVRDVEDEFDEALELIDDVLADTMSEPDAEKRYKRFVEFYVDLKEIEPMTARGSYSPLRDVLPDDVTGMAGGGEAEDADELEDVEPEDVRELTESVGETDDDDEEEGRGGNGGPTEDGDELEEGEGGGKGKPDEEAEESAEGSGGSGSGESGDGHPYPDHKGHKLVIRD